MLEFDKGWYSIYKCTNFDKSVIDTLEYSEYLNNSKRKYKIEILSKEKPALKCKIFMKKWISINELTEENNIIRNKILDIRSVIFHYFDDIDLIVFCSGSNNIKGVLQFLIKRKICQINLNYQINLSKLITTFDKSDYGFIVSEGKLINYKPNEMAIGNFHFKNIRNEYLDELLHPSKINYLTWLKLQIERNLSDTLKIEVYQNNTMYFNRESKSIFDLLILTSKSMEEFK